MYQDAAANIREIYRLFCTARYDFEEYIFSLVEYSEAEMSSCQKGNDSSSTKSVVRFSDVSEKWEEEEEYPPFDNLIEQVQKISLEHQNTAKEYLAGLNTIIIISGKYFGQEEGFYQEEYHDPDADDDGDCI